MATKTPNLCDDSPGIVNLEEIFFSLKIQAKTDHFPSFPEADFFRAITLLKSSQTLLTHISYILYI